MNNTTRRAETLLYTLAPITLIASFILSLTH